MNILDKVASYEIRGFKNTPGSTEWSLPAGVPVSDNRIDDPQVYAEYLKENTIEARKRGTQILRLVRSSK